MFCCGVGLGVDVEGITISIVLLDALKTILSVTLAIAASICRIGDRGRSVAFGRLVRDKVRVKGRIAKAAIGALLFTCLKRSLLLFSCLQVRKCSFRLLLGSGVVFRGYTSVVFKTVTYIIMVPITTITKNCFFQFGWAWGPAFGVVPATMRANTTEPVFIELTFN